MRALARTLVVLAFLACPPASARDTVTRPYPGLKLTKRVVPGQRIWVLETNLCAPGIKLRATKYDEARAARDCTTTCPTPNASPQDCRTRCTSRGTPARETPFVTVPKWAADRGVEAAINGNFTCAGGCDQIRGIDGWVRGLRVDMGNRDHHYVSPFAFGPGRVDVWNDAEVQGNARPAWASHIVSGHPTLVYDGAPQNNRAPAVDGRGDPLCNRNPRTAIGLSRDLRTLIWAVVDGRDAPNALGMTCNELRDLMIGFGAWNAANLDGGGSSTMWLRNSTRPNKVLNNPSDGAPRSVAVHFGIFAKGTGDAPFCMTPDPECAADEGFAGCSGTVLRKCHHLKVDETDCAARGLSCTTADGPARCVDPRCVAGAGARCDGGKVVTCSLKAGAGGEYAVTEAPCGAGQTCVAEGGPRCVDTSCAGRPDGPFCVAGGIGRCAGGLYSESSCAPRPCTDTPEGPRCVDPRCLGREDATFCTDSGARATCTDGAYAEQPCEEGTSCTDEGGVRCTDDRCVGALPEACVDGDKRASCVDGSYVETPCPAGSRCTDEGGAPLCVDERCVERPARFCSPEGLVATCAADAYAEEPCPEGFACAEGGCVEPPDGGGDSPDVEDPTSAYEAAGCGCGTGGGAVALSAVIALLRRRSRRSTANRDSVAPGLTPAQEWP